MTNTPFAMVKHSPVDFATVFVDHKNKRVYDICDGRAVDDLEAFSQKNFTGFDNVKVVTIDMSEVYRSFIRKNFKNSKIVVDRFHVQRAIGKLVNK